MEVEEFKDDFSFQTDESLDQAIILKQKEKKIEILEKKRWIDLQKEHKQVMLHAQDNLTKTGDSEAGKEGTVDKDKSRNRSEETVINSCKLSDKLSDKTVKKRLSHEDNILKIIRILIQEMNERATQVVKVRMLEIDK